MRPIGTAPRIAGGRRRPRRGGRLVAWGSPPVMARRRISSNCCRAAICWANSAVWMPWKRPSSQPTSWAWAIRSSASVGTVSSVNGSESRSSSSTSSGASPDSSSVSDRRWMSRSRTRDASSSGAERTSSSSCLIIEPIRMTLAGCSTSSATLPSPSSVSATSWPGTPAPPVPSGPSLVTSPTGSPSGPTTTMRCPGPGSTEGSLMPSSNPIRRVDVPVLVTDLVAVGAGMT